MTSVVVSDGGGNLVEYVTVVEESQQVSTALGYWHDCSSNDAVTTIKVLAGMHASFPDVSSVSSRLSRRRSTRKKWFSRRLSR